MKMMMMSCVALGLALLIAVPSDAQPFGTGHPVQCCFSFSTIKIPPRLIMKVEKTPSDCPKKGYVVTTPKNKFCKEEDALADL